MVRHLTPAVLLIATLACLPEPASISTAAESSTEAEGTFKEQTIYIPYDELQKTFEREGRGVFVPYERFQELWKAARAHERKPPKLDPPVDAMITQVDSTAEVEKEVVRVTSQLKIDLLGKGWITVPLRLQEAAVLSATIDGEIARLISSAESGHQLLVKKEGDTPEQIVLQLVYARSFTKAPGQNSVTFQAPIAPVNRWKIRVPERGVKVNVHPMLAATEVTKLPVDDNADDDNADDDPFSSDSNPAREEGEDPFDLGDEDLGDASPEEDEDPFDLGDESPEDAEPQDEGPDETVVLAFVGAAPEVHIQWTPKSEGATGLNALVSVQAQQQYTIAEGQTRTRTTLTYEVSRAELAELKVQVPATHKIVNVVDANVRQWDVQQADGTQTITIGLFEPARISQTVVIELEQFREDKASDQLSVPVVKALDVGRQRGIVAVQVAGNLRAEPVTRTGLLQLDASEIPANLARQKPLFSYRYASLPFELEVKTEKVTPRITVDQLVEAYLEPEKMTLDLLAKYDIQRAAVFELAVDLPPGFEIREVRGLTENGVTPVVVESHNVTTAAKADGDGADTQDSSRQLRVNLRSKALGIVGLQVRMERTLDDANLLSPTGQATTFTLEPPRVTGDHIARTQGRIVVYAPESLRLTAGQLTGLRDVAYEEASDAIKTTSRREFPKLQPSISYAFSDGEVEIAFSAQRRQPLVTASQLLVVRIDPGVVKYEATFRYNIRYSGVKSLRLDVPAELAASIRNETTAYHETAVDPQPEDVAEGYLAWRFEGDSELLGQQQFKLTWESPIRELDVGKSVPLEVPRLIPRETDRADGQIVLIKAETIDVGPQGQPQGLNPIDPQHDLMSGFSEPEAAAALEFRGDWQLTLNATRYQLQTMKQTSVERAVIRQVITRSDRVAVQALYRLRSNQQRLEVQLPADVGEGQIEFDTQPLRINGGAVTLERGADDKTFYVPLVGYGNNQPFLLELRYTLPGNGRRLDYPTFPNEPAVQQVSLVAYLPQERAYLGRRGPWTPEMSWDQGPLWSRSQTPNQGIDQLIRQLTSQLSIAGNPAADFPVDGRPLLFSTLQPDPPDDGSLRLTTIHRNILNGLAFGSLLLLGIALLTRPFTERIVWVSAVIGLLVLLGVFLPSLASEIIGQSLGLAAILVGLLWFAVSSMHVLPKLAPWNWQWRSESQRNESPNGVPGADVRGAEMASADDSQAGDQPAGDQPSDGGDHHE